MSYFHHNDSEINPLENNAKAMLPSFKFPNLITHARNLWLDISFDNLYVLLSCIYNMIKQYVIKFILFSSIILGLIWVFDPVLWDLLLEHFKYNKTSIAETAAPQVSQVTEPSVLSTPSSNWNKWYIVGGIIGALVIVTGIIMFVKTGTPLATPTVPVAPTMPVPPTVPLDQGVPIAQQAAGLNGINALREGIISSISSGKAAPLFKR